MKAYKVPCQPLYLLAAGLMLLFTLNGCLFLTTGKTVKYILYPVRSGDNLYTIAQRFEVSAEKLQRINGIRDPKLLHVGQTVRVPYHGQSLKKGPYDPSAATGRRAPPPQPQGASLRKVKLSSAARYVGKLAWPVGGSGGYVSSAFGWRWFSFHEGMDISAAEGTPVYAAHAGQVVYSGSKIQGYGNLVVIKAEGLLSIYAHNHVLRVRVGEQVRQGEHIADVGMTGHSTGPHLHFETRIRDASGKNAAVDPMVFLRSK